MAQIGELISAEDALRLALEGARKGIGFVAPNPLVGCTIVDREHRFLSVGCHQRLGEDHAEIDAIKKLPDPREIEGATLYVTLEPCAHDGRTPSCARALAKLPLKAVVYGLEDPNPLVAGKGAQILREAGIATLQLKDLDAISARTMNTLTTELEELAEIFLHNMRENSPFVALKVATSLDGMMALDTGESKWISGEEARRHVHYLRAHYDAVVIGRNTFLKDNPKLNVRLSGFENHANKVVLIDPAGHSLAEMAGSSLLAVRKPDDVFVAVAAGAAVDNPAGVKVLETKCDASGAFDIDEFLQTLWARQITSLFIEGGAQTFGHFLTHKRVHRLHLFTAPTLIGGRHGLTWTRYFGVDDLADRVTLRNVRRQVFGPDMYLTARLNG